MSPIPPPPPTPDRPGGFRRLDSIPLDPITLDPIPGLLDRVGAELASDFDRLRPMVISRAPGRLDVMGGIADYTGSLVCEATLDRAAAVVVQARADRQVQVFSFNLLDEHQPFTFQIPLDSLAKSRISDLRRDLAEPGRRWAGYLVGCLAILQEQGFVDLADKTIPGMNLALLSTVPLGAGISSSAAIEVAAMMAFCGQLGLLEGSTGKPLDPMKLSAMCQRVENYVVGAPSGIMDQVTSCCGQMGSLLRMLCQPHQLHAPLVLPAGIRVIGINSNVKHSVGGGMYGRTRCAAFMGHRMILEKMRDMGRAAGKPLESDPMNGYLANLDMDDYKRFFRPFLPESIKGRDFLDRYQSTIDSATTVDPALDYHVLGATDHHVLEANRVRNFVSFMESAATLPADTAERKRLLDKAGHLMYASHLSYTNDARLGADECDLLVDLVRRREHFGFYGAKITGGGSGGTVAVLANTGPRVEAVVEEIMVEYKKQTGHQPQAFLESSPGAWQVGIYNGVI